MTFGTSQQPKKSEMTGKPATSYEPTAEQLQTPEAAKPPAALDPKVAEGVDLLHDALKVEFGKIPFTAQAQASLARIAKVVEGLRGKRL